MSDTPVSNTDREIWREREGDYYADSIHVTEGGGIGINCGGHVRVMQVRKWHELERELTASQQANAELRKDAERYRWLRSNGKEIVFDGGVVTCYDHTYDKPEELDAAVDAAMQVDATKREG